MENNKYDVYIEDSYIEVYENIGGRTIKNKEEWKRIMREDYILDSLWYSFVETKHKNGEE